MIHILGIRHHGPGSARNVRSFLTQTPPDIILVEGPPEADHLLGWSAHSSIAPPIAILAYRPDQPEQAVFYPFAEFSPEWQAITFGAKNNIPVRFMDLPLIYKFALEKPAEEKEGDNIQNNSLQNSEIETSVHRDPMKFLADAAGFHDSEKWWEYMFEHRQSDQGVFEAVTEAMHSLRTELPDRKDRVEQLREAYMRKSIRQAEKEGYKSIVVVCGAWHVPALANMPSQKDDNELLKGLDKVKVETTWIPWTYNRLTFASGYGAGIQSPGWYDHVWKNPKDDGTLWMAKVARLFRKNDIDTSTAHIIEAVRLAESITALRNLNKAGLEELSEATLAVLCNGDDVLLRLIREELIVSDVIGQVPNEVPKPPLLQNVEKLQKKLRLPPEAGIKDLTLDLREEAQLERSVFLHRMLLIDVPWPHLQAVRSKGTFKEIWRLKWEPEFSIQIIEKGNWGNTLEEAAANYTAHLAKNSPDLKSVCMLLERVIPADLTDAVQALITQVNNLAAASNDVVQLLEALPSLVSVSRYGNVRQTDEAMMLNIVNSMIARVFVSLPAACVGIDEDSAVALTGQIAQLNESVSLLNQDDQRAEWIRVVQQISTHSQSAPIIAGYCTRLLTDARILQGDELTNRFQYTMSRASNTSESAAWLEGFLKGSGTILLLDDRLWNLVDQWVSQLNEQDFIALLPLMRRTFSQFTHAERRKLGEKAKKSGGVQVAVVTQTGDNIDVDRAKRALPVVAQLLGIKQKSESN